MRCRNKRAEGVRPFILFSPSILFASVDPPRELIIFGAWACMGAGVGRAGGVRVRAQGRGRGRGRS